MRSRDQDIIVALYAYIDDISPEAWKTPHPDALEQVIMMLFRLKAIARTPGYWMKQERWWERYLNPAAEVKRLEFEAEVLDLINFFITRMAAETPNAVCFPNLTEETGSMSGTDSDGGSDGSNSSYPSNEDI